MYTDEHVSVGSFRRKESEGTCRGGKTIRGNSTGSHGAGEPGVKRWGGISPDLWAREVWVGKRRGCSRWEVLGSNNNAEDSEQTGKKKMGGWKERKGTTERDGPRERLPISGRTGSLVYISSFVSHPPPPPVCLKTCVHATDCDPSPRASFCPSAACWCTWSGVSRSERHYGVEEHSNLSDPKEIARL